MARSADEARQAGMQTWQSQIIPTNTTISNTGASTGYQSVTGTVNQDASILFNMPEADRKDLAQRLKNAGYKIAVTGKYSDKLLSAYSTAAQRAALQSQMVGTPFTVRQYLDQETAARIAEGTGTGKPSVVEDITAYTDDAAKQIIDSIIRGTNRRKATESEIKKYTAVLKSIQNKAASTTTYKTVGGKQTRVTTPGIDEKQYLVDQISGSDEGKANKVLAFYETFMNALGGR